MKYITEIIVEHGIDSEHLASEFKEFGIAEEARKNGFDAFFVKNGDGICFRGDRYAWICNEHMTTDDYVAVSFSKYDHNHGWDISGVISINFRTVFD